MNEITYKKLVFNKTDIFELYLDNNWTSYTDEQEKLFAGVNNSLHCYAAYDKNKLIGLVRVVGDSNTIIYIQDILVLKAYQNKGIGSKLIVHIIEKYQDVRQIILSTDNTESQKIFYEKNGFKDYNNLNLVAFMLKK